MATNKKKRLLSLFDKLVSTSGSRTTQIENELTAEMDFFFSEDLILNSFKETPDVLIDEYGKEKTIYQIIIKSSVDYDNVARLGRVAHPFKGSMSDYVILECNINILNVSKWQGNTLSYTTDAVLGSKPIPGYLYFNWPSSPQFNTPIVVSIKFYKK
jgi:hypothetical protein